MLTPNSKRSVPDDGALLLFRLVDKLGLALGLASLKIFLTGLLDPRSQMFQTHVVLRHQSMIISISVCYGNVARWRTLKYS